MSVLSHIIFYVKDIPEAVSFYKNAFGIEPKFIHESQMYAELDTGETTLAFAAEMLGKENLPDGYIPLGLDRLPQAGEIVFIQADVQAAYEQAIQAGAIALVPPKGKPWGQTVAYVRDPNGVLIEIASPMK